MKKILILSFSLFLPILVFTQASMSLFNGENLDGWTIYGTEKWFVENGEIVCESGPDAQYGYLGTDQEFKNFELSVDFLQEADGNSGIFIRSSIDGTKIAGWQAEVAPPGNNSGGIYESYGRGWLIKPDPALDKALKMGEWNTMKIRAMGDNITTWLNGIQMITISDEKIGEAKGQIALQIHDGGGIRVRWKNLVIKELSTKPKFVHTVFFWMKEDLSKEEAQFFEEGMEKLGATPSILSYKWGKPAGTPRDVVDNSYSYAWIVDFASSEDQDAYQDDPIHLEFIEQCKNLWTKVQVYDTVIK